MATGAADGLVRVFAAETGDLLVQRRGHAGPVESIAWLGDSGRLASASWDRTVRTWSSHGDQQFQQLEGTQRFAWDARGTRIATGGLCDEASLQGPIQIHDAASGRVQTVLPRAYRQGLHCLDWSLDGNRIATADNLGIVRVWDADRGRILWHANAHRGEARSVAFSPDGRLLATGGFDHFVKLWDVECGELRGEFAEMPGKVGSVVWSPDGTQLAVADWRQNVWVCDASTGRRRLSMRLHAHDSHGASGQYSLAFSSNGKRLAAGSAEGAIVVWNVETGRELKTMTGHTSNVRSIAFHPDGHRLASGALDRTVRIWNVDSGDELLQLAGGQQVSRVAWSPDGGRLAAAGGDHIRIWYAKSVDGNRGQTGANR